MAARARVARFAAAVFLGILVAPIATPLAVVEGASGQAANVCEEATTAGTRPASASSAYGTAILSQRGRPAWILGMKVTRGATGQPLALRWNGRRWLDIAVPWRAELSGLMGGDLDGSETWAVGFTRRGPLLRPVVGHWAGGQWQDVNVAALIRGRATLVDVEALGSGQVIAVGAGYRAGSARATAILRAGGTWQSIDPATDGVESALLAVTQDPSGTPWAVGWQLRDGEPHPLVVTWTGGRWRTGSGASLAPGSTVLTDIAFRPNGEGWAVGYRVIPRTGRHHATLQRWDGHRWSEARLSWARDLSVVPRAVAFDARGRPAISGFVVAGNRGGEVGFVATRRSGTWRVTQVGEGSDKHAELTDVAAVGSGFVSVGGVRFAAVGGLQLALLVRGECAGQAITWSGTAGGDMQLDPQQEPVVTSVTVGDVRLQDVARSVGLAEMTRTYGGLAADFNRDGWTDLFIGRHGRSPKLMLGGATGFERRQVSFPMRDYHGCAAADVDADRSPDLYCTTGAFQGAGSKQNVLWMHPGRGRLVPLATTMGVVDPLGRGRRATFLNLDGDRYPDLLVTNEPDRVDGLPSTNRLFRNLDGTRFVPAPGAGLDRSVGGSCVVAADLDVDGDDDLLLCTTEAVGGRPNGLRVFRNDGGRMREVSGKLGVQPSGDVDALVADLNRDDRPDIVQLSPGSLVVHLGTQTGFVVGYRRDVADAAAVATGDVDGDGRLDLYVAQGASSTRNDLLLINRGGGRSFRSVVIPGTQAGNADDVIALDHDRNGLADFLVLNGAGGRGPIQLIAAFPR